MLAAAAGHAAVIDALAAHQSQPLVAEAGKADPAGKTSLDLAEATGHKGVAKVLRQARAVRAAADGDLKGLEATLKALDTDFPAARAMIAAAGSGRLASVAFLKERWQDRPLDEKLRLVGAIQTPDCPTNETALGAAVRARNIPAVQALLDDAWWKGPDGLRQFIQARPGGATAVFTDYYQSNWPETFAVVEAKVRELDAKKGPPEKK
jgi:hypothetical protein